MFYQGYPMFDGYVLTPLVLRQTVDLPPALTFMAQVLLGIPFRTLGVLLAVPLVACAFIATKMLYLHDVLWQEVELPRPSH